MAQKEMRIVFTIAVTGTGGTADEALKDAMENSSIDVLEEREVENPHHDQG